MREISGMKRPFTILLTLLALTAPALLAKETSQRSVVFRNEYGTPVYEEVYQLTKVQGKPVLERVRSYVYGPFAYRCMTPRTADHGGVKVRYYLKVPTLCFVPPGYKVCLERAHVYHHGNPILPYLYADFDESRCITRIPDFKEPIFYREAPLIPVGGR